MAPRKRKQQVVPSDPRLDFSHNEDLIGEILSWLPAKSLLRFRRVCKSWKDIISRPCFVNKHLSRAAVSRFQVLQCDGNDTKLDLKANKKPDLRRLFSTDIYSLTVGSTEILTVGSCNGLMCLQVSRKRGLYLLWNPCTGDTKMLPELTSISDYEFYGFGYDFANKDYKLIVGSESTSATGSCTTKVAVFTLKNCSWRTIEGLEHVRLRGYGCSLDGSLHWLECKRDPEDRWKETYRVKVKIISFDLGEEKFQAVVSLPTDFPQNWCGISENLRVEELVAFYASG
ncbi:PREDICTED: putative F-box protein At3g17480-like [Fragaria vesca subsp. vesca]